MTATQTREAETGMTTAEAAVELGVAVELVRAWARQGRLAYVWSARGRLFDPASVARFERRGVGWPRGVPKSRGSKAVGETALMRAEGAR